MTLMCFVTCYSAVVLVEDGRLEGVMNNERGSMPGREGRAADVGGI